MIQTIAFYLFATLVIASAVLTILARNPVHSVLWLILAFFNAAGLMLLVGAEFIAMLLIIVYVGAVAVLFLFVVMMLDIDFAELRAGFAQYLPFGVLLVIVLAAEMIFAVGAWQAGGIDVAARVATAPPADVTAEYRGARADHLHPLSLHLRGRRPDSARRADRRDRADPPGARRGQGAEYHGAEHAQARRCHAQRQARNRQGSGAVIGLQHYLVVSAILFVMGVFGIFLNRKNVIIILMAIELILLSVNINLVAFSAYLGDLVGQVFAMFVLTVAAGEAAIGLAILVIYFRGRGSIAVDDINRMKG